MMPSLKVEWFKRTTQTKKWNEERIFQVGDSVYLSTVNLTMPKGRARKLIPRYIGLMKVLNKIGATDTYTLDLLEKMRKRRIHLMKQPKRPQRQLGSRESKSKGGHTKGTCNRLRRCSH